MRLKTFSAATMAKAMELIRAEMGEDAIIVSTQPGIDGRGARVTAAVDTPASEETVFAAWNDDSAPPRDECHEIAEALAFQGLSQALTDRLLRLAQPFLSEGSALALAAAMDASFAFAPLPQAGPVRPAMLVGPPGTGKTIAVAKLATRLTRAGKTPTVITTDTRRAGGIDQLAAFTNILGLKLITSDDPDDLASAARAAGDNPVIIDSAGSNPFDVLEMETLAEQVRAAGAEPILVVSAGTDPMEAADIAHSFTALGAGRLLATRLDLSRRLGSVVAAAEATGLAFSEVSISPHVGDGLIALNPLSLARLILPDLRERPHHSPAFPVKEAAR